MKIMKAIIAVAACCAILGCDSNDSNAIKDPPITITFRQGVLSKHVMQVNNLSAAEGIEVYVYVANANNSIRSGNVVVPANGFKEFGALELGWVFKAGDRGFIFPVKYGKKLFFELSQNKQYRTWFGIDDIQEVDVAAQVRARLEVERKEAARTLIETIGQACTIYSLSHQGKLPNKLSELKKGDGDNPPFLEGDLKDPWGNEIKYEKKGKRFYLTSFGSDGKEGTEDDLTNIRNR